VVLAQCNKQVVSEGREDYDTMNIQTFRARLDALGYPNAVSEPDPEQEFTPAKFGTLLWREDGPELEIRLPDTGTKHHRVLAISTEQIEQMSDEIAESYIAGLEK